MIISHWLYPVTTLGPGRRLAIWVQGCNRKCQGCVSPELQSYEGMQYDVAYLANVFLSLIAENSLDGVTISGGEPFDQEEELLQLCSLLTGVEIIVYSGYSTKELLKNREEPIWNANIAVLITGPYMQELDDNLPLKGSSNQEIIYRNESVSQKYVSYLENTLQRKQQFFILDENVYMAGIPSKGQASLIRDKIDSILREVYNK